MSLTPRNTQRDLAYFFLGLIIGGISGFFGGWVGDVIQRFVEFIRPIPTLPL